MGLTVVENRHSPVLKKEVLEFLDVQKNSVIVDCTLGLGGHAEAILEKAGKLIGFDLDEKNLSEATNRLERFEKKLITVHSNFRYLSDELSKLGFDQVDGIFLDLGLSSPHLDEPDRGFSFREKGHLDMRYNRLDGESAYDIVNTASEERLADIIYEYGEERASRKIAKAIVKQRPIKTTTELADIVKSVIRGKQRIDPATKVFQALRIYVNDEINALKEVLPQALNYLKSGGRLIVISYHSLEDRIVKNFFRDSTGKCTCPKEIPVCTCDNKPILKILTKKPITPTREEISGNRRARSAKLRAIQKL